MSKRQHNSIQNIPEPEPQVISNDLDLTDNIIQHNEDPNLFEHLTEDFQDMMGDKQVLRNCIEKFIENTVDEFTLGIIFDIHRKWKTNAYSLDVNDSRDDETNKTEVFQHISAKNNQKCVCPSCELTVAPLRFARHLAKCMGISDTSRSSRNASRRAASNKDKGDTSAYAGAASDDDDDEYWSSRRSNRRKDRNGGKKNRVTPKKNSSEPEPPDPINVDIEGTYDEFSNLRYIIHGRRTYVLEPLEAPGPEPRSNSSSPTDSIGNTTPPKKRDKSKKKSKAKDRGSPSNSLSFD